MGVRRNRQVTVHDLLPRVLDLCPARSLPTYRAGFVRLDARFGPTRLAAVTPLDLKALAEDVQQTVGRRTVARAQASGRRLRSFDTDAHGRGAAENFLRAARFFFRVAVNDGLLTRSPAAAVPIPPRPPAPERPLTSAELSDLLLVASTTGGDPQLDRRIVLFLRHTAARREGCLNLRVDHLDAPMRRVTISEKFGQARVLPLNHAMIVDLLGFAHARGGETPEAAVFRFADGHPVTRRRFNTLFDRVDQFTDWAEPLDVGAHWLRHTTLSDIAAVAGVRVAEAYAGHSTNNLPPIFRYTEVTFEDLTLAYEAVFGPRG